MLYLADVGQNKVEEVDIITKGGNYGWNVKEGTFYFDSASGNPVTAPVRPVPPDLIDPIAIYDQDDGLAIICGFVYHGAAIPALQGRLACGDWGSFTAPSGRGWKCRAGSSSDSTTTRPRLFSGRSSSFQKSGIVTAMVGLLQALPGTKLHQRLNRQGRLLGDTTGDNVDGTTNFIPQMKRETLRQG